MPRAAAFHALLLAAAIVLSCGSGGANPGTTAAALEVVSGNSQTGYVGEELPNALVVRVTGQDGRPVAGQIVNFRVVTGGGTVFGGTEITDADGLAQDRWTLGITLGAQQLEARAVDSKTGAPLVFATFQATAIVRVAGGFVPAGTLSTARSAHTATLLQSGKVLIAGGYGEASAEVYDPATGLSTPTTAPMSTARFGHTATLLPSGKVLVAGGWGPSSVLDSTELYDPGTDTFSPGGSLAGTLHWATAVLLNDGRVLIVGGGSNEIHDPATGTSTSLAAPLNRLETAALLPDGRVLIVGSDGSATAVGTVFDPATGTFSSSKPMNYAHRSNEVATALSSGVLLTGGYSTSSSADLASAEIYDPASGTFSRTGDMAAARTDHGAVVLPGGRALILGGDGRDPADPAAVLNLASAELYDPASRTFRSAGTMSVARVRPSATALPDGRVLVTGGGVGSEALKSVELWVPAQN